VLARGDYGLLQIAHRPNEPQAPHEVFRTINLECARANVQIGFANRLRDLFDGHSTRKHGFGVDVDLVFAHIATDGSDLGDAWHGLEGEAHNPILRRSKLVQVPSPYELSFGASSFEGVPEHLSERGGVRPERGRHTIGECASRQ